MRERLTDRRLLFTLAEVLILALWAWWFATPYLDFDPWVRPSGREYPSAIQPYYFWRRLLECGLCALWNGSVRGGVPALVDVHAGILHPLPMISTLLFGVDKGMKLMLAGAFLMAGLAQWWLGRAMGLGRLTCLWGGAMAVVAGNLVGRMEGGWPNLVLSGAACALVLPAAVGLGRHKNGRWAVALGATLAMAAVSGQGYLQIGLLISLPLLLLFVEPQKPARLTSLLGVAALLAGLLAAPMLLPVVDFLPEFGKAEDAEYRLAQPARFAALNLVIDDVEFYRRPSLQKAEYPALYLNFVGWIPLILAFAALFRYHRDRDRRALVYLTAMVLLPIWLSSGRPFQSLMGLAPWDRLDALIASVRNPSLIAGLAVAPLLGMAMIGLDALLQAGVKGPTLALSQEGGEAFSARLDLRWLLVIPLLLSLAQATSFGRLWMNTDPIAPEVRQELQALRTDDLQWVMPPFGDHDFVEPGLRMGLKLVSDLKPWYWLDHPDPEPYLEIVREGEGAWTEQMTAHRQVGTGATVYRNSDLHAYATIQQAPDDTVQRNAEGAAYSIVQQTPASRLCTATGSGGHIDVRCPDGPAGQLRVLEHHSPSWRVRVDGDRSDLRDDSAPWLSLDLPAGAHEIQLRYRPWAPYLGLLLALLGALLSIRIWRDTPL